MAAERTVLFVCVENSGRSLMAEAMFNADPPPGWHAVSAGTAPAAVANPRTGPMLREIGIEPPDHSPQLLTKEMMDQSRTVITMGCLNSESCPARLKTMDVTDWGLEDPAQLDDDGFRRVRDDIRSRVAGLRLNLIVSDRTRARIAARP